MPFRSTSQGIGIGKEKEAVLPNMLSRRCLGCSWCNFLNRMNLGTFGVSARFDKEEKAKTLHESNSECAHYRHDGECYQIATLKQKPAVLDFCFA